LTKKQKKVTKPKFKRKGTINSQKRDDFKEY